MPHHKVIPEVRTCPVDGVTFEVGGRGRRQRKAVYCSRRCQGFGTYRNLPAKKGSSAPRPKKARDTLHNEAWLRARYLTDGMGTPAIAKLTGVTVQSVVFAMRSFGIERRSLLESAALRELHRTDRKTVTQADLVTGYGGRCVCCGEAELVFLSIDHINGGGSEHRRQIGGGRKLRQYLKAQGWPTDGYRILCMNCQFGTMYGKVCPHQTPLYSQP